MEESSPAVSRSGSLPPGVGTPEESRPPPSPLSGAYLLVIISEPQTDAHKAIILQKLAKAFLSWNTEASGIDIERELAIVTALCSEGDFAKNGERLIQNASEHLVTEILIHPQVNTMRQCIRNLLSSFTKYRFIIHSGYAYCGNGSWILQDGTFSTSDFIDTFQEIEVQRVIRAYERTVKIDICCISEGTWKQSRINQEPFTKICQVEINPSDKISPGNAAVREFVDYLERFIRPTSIQELLEPSDIVGNIRFTHPTLYVFPGGEGDAALFGINGFNMLVDGGFSRKACFWNFVRHLDRLDGVLLTRINNSNMGGMSGIVQRKVCSHVYPQIGHFFSNLQIKQNLPSPDGDKDKEPLLVNLIDEGHKLVLNLKQLELKPHHCYRDANSEPINLYHKVGHGKLDMYVISPAKDSREVKEFLSQWNNYDAKLFSSTLKSGSRELRVPLQNLVSICALLVWQPANPEDHVTRILFPGSAPQHKIFEGFEKMKQLEFLKDSICTMKSITPISLTVLKKQKIISSEIITDSLHKGDSKNILGESEVDAVHKSLTEVKKLKPRKLIEKAAPKEKSEVKTAVSKTIEKTTDNTDVISAKKEEKKKIEVKKIMSKPQFERKFKPPVSSGAADKKSESEKSSPTTPKRTVTSTKVTSETTKDVTARPTQEGVKSHIIKPATETKSEIDSTKDQLTKSSLRISKEPVPTKERTLTKEQAPVKEPAITKDHTLLKEHKSKVSTDTAKTIIRPTNRTQTPPKIFNAAKSLKDENNRKVAESKRETRTRTPPKPAPILRPAAPKKDEDASALKTEKKPVPIKQLRLPPKVPSTQSSAPVPVKKVVPIRPLKVEEAKRNLKKDTDKTDSSAVSTPSMPDADAKHSLDIGADLLKIEKIDGTTEILAQTDDEFKQGTNVTTYVSNIYRKEGHSTEDDEDEILVIETTEMKQINNEEQKYLRDEKESEKKKEQEKAPDKSRKSTDMIKPSKVEIQKSLQTHKTSAEMKTPDSVLSKDLLTPEEKDKLSDEVEGIITTAAQLVSQKESDVKSTEEDQIRLEVEKDERIAFESASTTTAPTMPEDEKVEDIKQEVEEKYDKEETKEKSPEAKEESEFPDIHKVEEIRKFVSKKDVKTPDEVADLPVDDEAEASLQQEERDQLRDLIDHSTIMQPVTNIVELKHAEYVTINPTPISSPDEKPSPIQEFPDKDLKEKITSISLRSDQVPLEDESDDTKQEIQPRVSNILENQRLEKSDTLTADKLLVTTEVDSHKKEVGYVKEPRTDFSPSSRKLDDEQIDSTDKLRIADEEISETIKINSESSSEIVAKHLLTKSTTEPTLKDETNASMVEKLYSPREELLTESEEKSPFMHEICQFDKRSNEFHKTEEDLEKSSPSGKEDVNSQILLQRELQTDHLRGRDLSKQGREIKIQSPHTEERKKILEKECHEKEIKPEKQMSIPELESQPKSSFLIEPEPHQDMELRKDGSLLKNISDEVLQKSMEKSKNLGSAFLITDDTADTDNSEKSTIAHEEQDTVLENKEVSSKQFDSESPQALEKFSPVRSIDEIITSEMPIKTSIPTDNSFSIISGKSAGSQVKAEREEDLKDSMVINNEDEISTEKLSETDITSLNTVNSTDTKKILLYSDASKELSRIILQPSTDDNQLEFQENQQKGLITDLNASVEWQKTDIPPLESDISKDSKKSPDDESSNNREFENIKTSLKTTEIQSSLESKCPNDISLESVSLVSMKEKTGGETMVKKDSHEEKEVFDSKFKDEKVLQTSLVSPEDIQKHLLEEVSIERKSSPTEAVPTEKDELKIPVAIKELLSEKSEIDTKIEGGEMSPSGKNQSGADLLLDTVEVTSEQYKYYKNIIHPKDQDNSFKPSIVEHDNEKLAEKEILSNIENKDRSPKTPECFKIPETQQNVSINKPPGSSAESINEEKSVNIESNKKLLSVDSDLNLSSTKEKKFECQENVGKVEVTQSILDTESIVSETQLVVDNDISSEKVDQCILKKPNRDKTLQDNKSDHQLPELKTFGHFVDSKKKVSPVEAYDKINLPKSSIPKKDDKGLFVEEMKDELEVHKLQEVKEKSKLETGSKSTSPGASVSDDSTEELTKIEKLPIQLGELKSPDQNEKEKSQTKLERNIELKKNDFSDLLAPNEGLRDQSKIHEDLMTNTVVKTTETICSSDSKIAKESCEKEQKGLNKSENNETTDLQTGQEFIREQIESHNELIEKITGSRRNSGITEKHDTDTYTDCQVSKEILSGINSKVVEPICRSENEGITARDMRGADTFGTTKELLKDESKIDDNMAEKTIKSSDELETESSVDSEVSKKKLSELKSEISPIPVTEDKLRDTKIHDNLMGENTDSHASSISDKIEPTSTIEEVPSEMKSKEKIYMDENESETEKLMESERADLKTEKFIHKQAEIDDSIIKKNTESKGSTLSDKIKTIIPVDTKLPTGSPSELEAPKNEILYDIEKLQKSEIADQYTVEESIQEHTQIHDDLIEKITKSQRSSISEKIETISPIDTDISKGSQTKLQAPEKEVLRQESTDIKKLDRSEITDQPKEKDFIKEQTLIHEDIIEKITKSQRSSISDKVEAISPINTELGKGSPTELQAPEKEVLHQESTDIKKLDRSEITDQPKEKDFIKEQTLIHEDLIEKITKSQRSSISDKVEAISPINTELGKGSPTELQAPEKEVLHQESTDIKKLDRSEITDQPKEKDFIKEQTLIHEDLIEKITKSQRSSISDKVEAISPINTELGKGSPTELQAPEKEVLHQESTDIKKLDTSEIPDQPTVKEFIQEQTQILDDLTEKITKSQRSSISEKIETTSPNDTELSKVSPSELEAPEKEKSTDVEKSEKGEVADQTTVKEFIQEQTQIRDNLMEKRTMSQRSSIIDKIETISPIDTQPSKVSSPEIEAPGEESLDQESADIKKSEKSEIPDQPTVREFIQEQTQIHDDSIENITKSQRSSICDKIETISPIDTELTKLSSTESETLQKEVLHQESTDIKKLNRGEITDQPKVKEFIKEQTQIHDDLIEKITQSQRSSISEKIETTSPIDTEPSKVSPSELEAPEKEKSKDAEKLEKSEVTDQTTVKEFIQEQTQIHDNLIEKSTMSQRSSVSEKIETISPIDTQPSKVSSPEIEAPGEESLYQESAYIKKSEKSEIPDQPNVKEFIQEQTQINDDLIENIIKSQRNSISDKIETISPVDTELSKVSPSELEAPEKEVLYQKSIDIKKSEKSEIPDQPTVKEFNQEQTKIHDDSIENITKSQRSRISDKIETISPIDTELPKVYPTELQALQKVLHRESTDIKKLDRSEITDQPTVQEFIQEKTQIHDDLIEKITQSQRSSISEKIETTSPIDTELSKVSPSDLETPEKEKSKDAEKLEKSEVTDQTTVKEFIQGQTQIHDNLIEKRTVSQRSSISDKIETISPIDTQPSKVFSSEIEALGEGQYQKCADIEKAEKSEITDQSTVKEFIQEQTQLHDNLIEKITKSQRNSTGEKIETISPIDTELPKVYPTELQALEKEVLHKESTDIKKLDRNEITDQPTVQEFIQEKTQIHDDLIENITKSQRSSISEKTKTISSIDTELSKVSPSELETPEKVVQYQISSDIEKSEKSVITDQPTVKEFIQGQTQIHDNLIEKRTVSQRSSISDKIEIISPIDTQPSKVFSSEIEAPGEGQYQECADREKSEKSEITDQSTVKEFIQEQTQLHDDLIEKITKSQRNSTSEKIETISPIDTDLSKGFPTKLQAPEKEVLHQESTDIKKLDRSEITDQPTVQEFIQEQTQIYDDLIEKITKSQRSSISEKIETISPINTELSKVSSSEIEAPEEGQYQECADIKKSEKSEITDQPTVKEFIQEQTQIHDDLMEKMTKSQRRSISDKIETISPIDTESSICSPSKLEALEKEVPHQGNTDAKKAEKSECTDHPTVEELIQEQTQIHDDSIGKISMSQRSIISDEVKTISPVDTELSKGSPSKLQALEIEVLHQEGKDIKKFEKDEIIDQPTVKEFIQEQTQIHDDSIEKITKSQRSSISDKIETISPIDTKGPPSELEVSENKVLYQKSIDIKKSEKSGNHEQQKFQGEEEINKLKINTHSSITFKEADISLLQTNEESPQRQSEIHKDLAANVSPTSPQMSKESYKEVKSNEDNIGGELRKNSTVSEKLDTDVISFSEVIGGTLISENLRPVNSELQSPKESIIQESSNDNKIEEKLIKPNEEAVISSKPIYYSFDSQISKDSSTENSNLRKKSFPDDKACTQDIKLAQLTGIHRHTLTSIGPVSYSIDKSAEEITSELILENAAAIKDLNKESFDNGQVTSAEEVIILDDKDTTHIFTNKSKRRMSSETLLPELNKLKEKSTELEKLTEQLENQKKTLVEETSTMISKEEIASNQQPLQSDKQSDNNEEVITSYFSPTPAKDTPPTIQQVLMYKDSDQSFTHQKLESLDDQPTAWTSKISTTTESYDSQTVPYDDYKLSESGLQEDTISVYEGTSKEGSTDTITSTEFSKEEADTCEHIVNIQKDKIGPHKIRGEEENSKPQQDIKTDNESEENIIQVVKDFIQQERIFTEIDNDQCNNRQADKLILESKCDIKSDQTLTSYSKDQIDNTATLLRKNSEEQSKSPSKKNNSEEQSDITLTTNKIAKQTSQKEISPEKQSDTMITDIYTIETQETKHDSHLTEKSTYISIDPPKLFQPVHRTSFEDSKIEPNKIQSSYDINQTEIDEHSSAEKIHQEKPIEQLQEIIESPVMKFTTHAEESVINIGLDAIRKLDNTADVEKLLKGISDQIKSDSIETTTEYFIEKDYKEPSGKSISDSKKPKDRFCSNTYVTSTTTAVTTDKQGYSTVVAISKGEVEGNKHKDSNFETVKTITTSSPTVQTTLTTLDRRGSQPSAYVEADKSHYPISPELQLDATQMCVKFTADRKDYDDSKRLTLKCKSNSEEFYDSSSSAQDVVGDLSSKFEKREPVVKTVSLPIILDEKFEDAKTNVDVEKGEDFSRSYPYLEKISNNEVRSSTNLSDPALTKQVEGELQSKSISLPVIKQPDDSEQYMALPHLYKTNNLEDLRSKTTVKTTMASTAQEQKESEDGTRTETTREESIVIGPITETEEPTEDTTYTFVKTIRTFYIDDESGGEEATTVTTSHTNEETTTEKSTAVGQDEKAGPSKKNSALQSDISPGKSAQQSQIVDNKQSEDSTKTPNTTDISQISASMMQSFYGSCSDNDSDSDQEKLNNKSELHVTAGEGESSNNPKNDPISDWGKPLGLPDARGMSTLLIWNPLEDWGKPLGLPSPTPTPILDGQHRESNGDIEITLAPVNMKGTPKRTVKKPPEKNHTARDSSKNRDSSTKKTKPSKQVNPLYVDLAYVPHHGNPYYTNVEFFKRIRARYYVFSGTDPNKDVFNALLEGKKSWENQDLEVTIISTYDTDVLGYWITENEETLANLRIDLAPSASRCTINLQDHDTSCSAYRLEF